MTDKEVWTVGRLLTWTNEYLADHGSDTPRLDAEVLLSNVLSCPRIELYTRFEEDPGDDVRGRFRDLVRQRAEGRPVAQIVGEREFYSLPFEITPDVLIPRPETEHLVVRLLDIAKQHKQGKSVKIADIGTGSGIIAVCAAKHLKDAKVTAIDISPEALDVARRNAHRHGVAERITFLEGNLLENLGPDEKFDIIASNPPYIAEGDPALDENVVRHEPRLALIAGKTGTEVIERLIDQSIRHLAPAGRLLIEISPFIHEGVCRLIDRQAKLNRLPTIRDLQRHERVVESEVRDL